MIEQLTIEKVSNGYIVQVEACDIEARSTTASRMVFLDIESLLLFIRKVMTVPVEVKWTQE